MTNKKENPIVNRTMVLLLMVTVTFVGLIGQLGNLALGQQRDYGEIADSQALRELGIPAPRGTIVDRKGTALVINRPAFHLLIHYPFYNDDALLVNLARVLDLPVEPIRERVKQSSSRPFVPVRVLEDMTQVQVTSVIERKPTLPGVEVLADSVRQYRYGDLASHLVGYVQSDSATGEMTGRAGLEAFYDELLQGKPGRRQVVVNIYGEPLGYSGQVPPTPGHNLTLTIDAKIQEMAERALAWQMHRIRTIPHAVQGRTYPNANAGAVVAMDVRTGAILAMASYPTYDPNLFVGGISVADWSRLMENPHQPMLNRAVQSAYHPGSTWKMLTGAAALTAKITTPQERFFSGREYAPTGQRDWVPGGHGWVDMADALKLSSNIYFYEMGLRMGIDRQVEAAKGFGFGALTGVDLYEEVAGFLPDAEYRSKHDWWMGQTSSAAIGQIFATTPLQLARYTAALANGGKLMQPYLVQSVQDATGKTVRETAPKEVGKLPITPEALATVVEGMKRVNRPGGTADYAIWPLPGIPTAGKTGTAENFPRDDYGLFVAFAPAENPEIAVAVAIEQAGNGGSTGPVSRAIFAEYFGVELPERDPARVPADFQPAKLKP